MKLEDYAQRKITESAAPAWKQDWKYRKIDSLLKQGAKVLDIGCASGKFSDVWRYKNISYSGLDYNEVFIEHGKNLGLEVQQFNASKDLIPYWDETFDFVYCSHVIEHLLSNEQIAFFLEISRVLKSGGTLLMFAPTPYHWYFWDDETHQRPCTHGQLSGLARNFGLSIRESKYSLIRIFPDSLQRFLRLPPIRWFLWETYLVARKP